MNEELYIYKKEIDWSVLHLGINIPVNIQKIFHDNLQINLKRGEIRKINILLDGEKYSVKIFNIFFDEKKYPTHKDLLQIRYTPNSDISKRLRDIFANSYNYLAIEKSKLKNKRKPINVPQNQREYIAIYTTPIEDEFYIECITNIEISKAKQEFLKMSENDLEMLLAKEENSEIIIKTATTKIRKLDRSIGNALKVAYNFKCQICEMDIGKLYGAKVLDTHHIEYFSVSMNNNASNIMVICPNHHSIIHATNPIFDKKNLIFQYPNGYNEGLKLNLHL
ncbi:MAG: HNH endonuclease [Firmicutes bacterium]|nr:HNH endonuclease [Bacillota bacterium]